MEHPTNNSNNNQDDGSDKQRKRPVPAGLDELSKPQKTSTFQPIQHDHGPYGINMNQHRSSGHQLGPNFSQNPQLPLNFPLNNLISNNNLLHSRVFPSYVSQQVLGPSQIPRSESNVSFIKNSVNPSSNNLVESSRQRENPEGPKGKDRKSCNCKKSRCLTLYCACFANKRYCVDCKCQDCENSVENEHGVSAAQKELLANNPTAFDPQIIGDEHKKGCTCKNSGCEKRYCVCKANNVKCTSKCRCVNCQNNIGARDYGEIPVPGEMSTQAKQNNMTANVPPVGLHSVPVQYPNYSYGSTENSENQRVCHASLPANLETFLASQPPHFPSNSHHYSINNGVAYATVMPGLQGDSITHNSLLNNNSSSSRSGTLINENSETNHDTVPGDVPAANATLNTQHLTPFSEALPNDINAPSNNNNSSSSNNNNNSNTGWPSSQSAEQTKIWMIRHHG